MINARFVVAAVNFSFGHQVAQILKTLIIHGEQGNMKTLLIVSWIAVGHFARSDVSL
jgi:hypothetical protein